MTWSPDDARKLVVMSGHKRVAILLELLGRKVRVVLDPAISD
jgi:hypothetical protein